MQRRNFIKLTSTASALTLLPSDVFAILKSSGMAFCPDTSSKKIVLIQLAGANDGLNTLVPINQYDLYSNLRPNIRIKDTGIHKYIPLDSTLSSENQIGLHPVLKGFKSLYDSGLMKIIQGVGYPNNNKSHFKSSDIWLSGGDGTPANFTYESGWIGRFIENYYTNYLQSNFPLGIQLGSGDNSLGFHGEKEHRLSININNQDFSGFYSVVNGLGGSPPTNIPNSEYGEKLQFLIDVDASANKYGETISTAFNVGSNTVSYSQTDLSNQLKTVARFISGGLETKIYLVRIGGFDTHDSQVASSTESHKGNHANLLKEVSDAVHSFITDLNNQNKGNDVVALTFSEFGRKAAENANLGTDHGEVAPMFIFGNSITPGVTGTNVNLNEAVLENNFQTQTIQYDYRSVFGTILQDWLGTANDTLDLSLFDKTLNTGFGNSKIQNLIKNNHLVPPTCYSSKATAFNTNQKYDVILSPNPGIEVVNLNSLYNNDIISCTLYSIDGKLIGKYYNTIASTFFQINVQSLSVGYYNIIVETKFDVFSKRLIIRR